MKPTLLAVSAFLLTLSWLLPIQAAEKKSTDLLGKVVVEKSDGRRRVLLKVGKKTYEVAGKDASEALRKYSGREVEVRCFLEEGKPAPTIVRVLKAVKAAPLSKRLTRFVFPCQAYSSGLKGKGNFGVLISRRVGSPFGGTYHLAEDVWLAGGTEVVSVADGVVMYSDFSPTWTDARGNRHWNLGNVVVIEHKLDPPEKDMKSVCSFYVHLGAKRRVKTGDLVTCGQPIGAIGKNKSKENGYYPAHLHFGLHKGPYHQLSPAQRRELIRDAATTGLPFFEKDRMVMTRGIVKDIKLVGKTSVVVRLVKSERVFRLGLEVHSTSPDYKPKPIMGWCSGYGDRLEVKDWVRPSSWIQAHLSNLDK